MTIDQVAEAFIKGQRAQSHNSKTDGQTYYLHDNRIAWKGAGRSVIIHWCGWYTVTTANHLNSIAKAYGVSHRFSRKLSQDSDISTEILYNGLN